MAGRGERVKQLGPCKPLINVVDRPIFSWCLTSLSTLISDGDTLIVTTTKFFEDAYGVVEVVKNELRRLFLNVDLKFTILDDVPNGPAVSVYSAREHYINSDETIVVNSDQFINFTFPEDGAVWDSFVPLYVNTSGFSSYAEIFDGKIARIEEKSLISNYASAGVYGFSRGDQLADCLSASLKGEPHHNNEYFVGPALNEFIASGGVVVPSTVISKYDLGNIEKINEFIKIIESMCNSRLNPRS